MKCGNCGQDTNPTLVYCTVCGVPTDADVTDVLEEEGRKQAELLLIKAVQEAQKLCVLGVFLFACVLGLRFVLLSPVRPDAWPSYAVPWAVVDEGRTEAPQALPLDPLEVPLPTEDR